MTQEEKSNNYYYDVQRLAFYGSDYIILKDKLERQYFTKQISEQEYNDKSNKLEEWKKRKHKEFTDLLKNGQIQEVLKNKGRKMSQQQ